MRQPILRRRADKVILAIALTALGLNLAMTAIVARVAMRISGVLRSMDLDRACEKAGYERAGERISL